MKSSTWQDQIMSQEEIGSSSLSSSEPEKPSSSPVAAPGQPSSSPAAAAEKPSPGPKNEKKQSNLLEDIFNLLLLAKSQKGGEKQSLHAQVMDLVIAKLIEQLNKTNQQANSLASQKQPAPANQATAQSDASVEKAKAGLTQGQEAVSQAAPPPTYEQSETEKLAQSSSQPATQQGESEAPPPAYDQTSLPPDPHEDYTGSDLPPAYEETQNATVDDVTQFKPKPPQGDDESKAVMNKTTESLSPPAPQQDVAQQQGVADTKQAAPPKPMPSQQQNINVQASIDSQNVIANAATASGDDTANAATAGVADAAGNDQAAAETASPPLSAADDTSVPTTVEDFMSSPDTTTAMNDYSAVVDGSEQNQATPTTPDPDLSSSAGMAVV